ncbi:MAG: T9SS type A sorting domain-containing protein [Bacteroidales bacterium]|nr:T9SS type A sorting domain-containing protein [Bacteroidales bacterium]
MCINISDNNTFDFSIFPNPAKESFSVLCDGKESIKISVFDLNGKIVISVPNYQGEEIITKNLISGIYFVKLQSLQTTVCKKLFVE